MNNWKRDFTYWQVGEVLYVSVVFTWNINKVLEFMRFAKANQKVFTKLKAKASYTPKIKKIVVGGPAALLMPDKFKDLAEVRKTSEVEPILFHNPLATYTARGCPNKCSFCAVPKIDGNYTELKDFAPRPIVCDNNFLSSSTAHIKRAVEKLKTQHLVDFNSGFDVRFFTKEKAVLLTDLKNMVVRFAFDQMNQEKHLERSLKIVKELGLKKHAADIPVYVLYGYKDTPEEALYRVRRVLKLGMNPYPMRYQPLDSLVKDEYVNTEKGWTEHELKRFRYYWTYGRRLKMYTNKPTANNPKQELIPYEEFHLGKRFTEFSSGSLNII
jgi:hypothetical protein